MMIDSDVKRILDNNIDPAFSSPFSGVLKQFVCVLGLRYNR